MGTYHTEHYGIIIDWYEECRGYEVTPQGWVNKTKKFSKGLV